MKRNYELTILLPDSVSEKDKDAKVKKIQDLVESYKGAVTKAESWGKKRLAYKIGRYEEGYYEHFKLELDPASQTKLDNQLRVDEELLRYLFVRV